MQAYCVRHLISSALSSILLLILSINGEKCLGLGNEYEKDNPKYFIGIVPRETPKISAIPILSLQPLQRRLCFSAY